MDIKGRLMQFITHTGLSVQAFENAVNLSI